MAEVKKTDFENVDHILDEEDEATIALLKKRMKSFDESRLIPAEQVRQRILSGLQNPLQRKRTS